MERDPTNALPSAPMAEKSILSLMMQYPDRFIRRALGDGMKAEMFHHHGKLFGEMVDFHAIHNSLDLAAFSQALHLAGRIEGLGGPAIFAEVYTYAAGGGSGWEIYVGQLREAYARRLAITTAQKLSESDDSEDAIRNAEDALAAIREAVSGPRRALDANAATAEFLAALQYDYEAGELPGVSTGFPELDAISGGLRPGELWVVAAKSTRGKSVLMFQIAAEFLTVGKRVAIFSIELMTREVIGRLVTVIGRINFGCVTQPRTATKRDMAGIQSAAETLAASNLHVDASAGQTLDSIRGEAQRIRDANGEINLVVVDYIQICGVDRVKNEMREREIARISGGLKQLAKELRCPVLTASQLNDQGQTRESRSIEQDADALLFICEDGIKIGKLRNGRRNDVLPLFLDGSKQRFSIIKPS